MLIRIIIIAVILLILVAVYIMFRPKDNALHRNMKPGTGKIIRIIIVAAILVCAFFIIRDSYSLSQGKGIFSEKTESGYISVSSQKPSKDEVIVSISEDTVTINKKTLRNMDEVEKLLFEQISRGKSVRIIDNYALASTYNEVIGMLESMGVGKDSITEIVEP